MCMLRRLQQEHTAVQQEEHQMCSANNTVVPRLKILQDMEDVEPLR